MQRIAGVDGGFFVRLILGAVRRAMKRMFQQDVVPEPWRVSAHQPALLWGLAQMEGSQQRMQTVPAKLKVLASLKVAALTGCPF